MASPDPSFLPFRAGEILDESMNLVAIPQTPDPRPASGSREPMKAPRVELHRHGNFHQLNQVNVPKGELHQHELRQLHQVYVAPQVDPQILTQATKAVSHARSEAPEAVVNVRTEAVGVVPQARAHVANVEKDATKAVTEAQNRVTEVQNEALRKVLQVEKNKEETIKRAREETQNQALQAIADVEKRAMARLKQQQEEFEHEKSKLLHKLSVATGTVVESHHDTGKEDILEMLSELDSQVKSLCQRQLDFEVQSKAVWDEMKADLESLNERVSSVEGWYEDDQEVVKLVSPDGSPIRAPEASKTTKDEVLPNGSPPGSPHHSSDGEGSDSGRNHGNRHSPFCMSNMSDSQRQDRTLEDQCL